MANCKSVNQFEREIEEKEVACQSLIEPKINRKDRSIEMLNAPWSLIPVLETQMKAGKTLRIPYNTPFLEYKIVDFVILSEEETVRLVLELDKVPDFESLSNKLKIHEFLGISQSSDPKQIRAERLKKYEERESRIDEVVDKINSKMVDNRACCMCGNIIDGTISSHFNRRVQTCYDSRIYYDEKQSCITDLCAFFNKEGVEISINEMVAGRCSYPLFK
jgi:hypothetical protein